MNWYGDNSGLQNNNSPVHVMSKFLCLKNISRIFRCLSVHLCRPISCLDGKLKVECQPYEVSGTDATLE